MERDYSTAPIQVPVESEPSTGVSTAVATPHDSKQNSRPESIRGVDAGDAEKGRGVSGTIYASNALKQGEYPVPVLEKGIKSALTQPVSSMTKARIWYNPYRQVRFQLVVDVNWMLMRLFTSCSPSAWP